MHNIYQNIYLFIHTQISIVTVLRLSEFFSKGLQVVSTYHSKKSIFVVKLHLTRLYKGDFIFTQQQRIYCLLDVLFISTVVAEAADVAFRFFIRRSI